MVITSSLWSQRGFCKRPSRVPVLVIVVATTVSMVLVVVVAVVVMIISIIAAISQRGFCRHQRIFLRAPG